jgi:hypothetical protein
MNDGRRFLRPEIDRLGVIRCLFLYPELYVTCFCILDYMLSVLYPELHEMRFNILNYMLPVFIPINVCYLFSILNYII